MKKNINKSFFSSILSFLSPTITIIIIIIYIFIKWVINQYAYNKDDLNITIDVVNKYINLRDKELKGRKVKQTDKDYDNKKPYSKLNKIKIKK